MKYLKGKGWHYVDGEWFDSLSNWPDGLTEDEATMIQSAREHLERQMNSSHNPKWIRLNSCLDTEWTDNPCVEGYDTGIEEP